MTKKYYYVGDNPFLTRKLRAVHTGEFRAPKKGEYYLSGAIPAAYQTPNDLTTEFWILRVVKVRVETHQTIVEIDEEGEAI